MSDEKWYHGRLSRQKAEELVIRAGLDGSFVVRASESILGAYALSVLSAGQIHTYRILPTENRLLAVQTINGVQQRKFQSINELITAYRNPQNGLVCGLLNPVGPEVTSPVPPPPSTPVPNRSDVWFPQAQETPRPTMPPPNIPPPQPSRSSIQKQRVLPPVPPPNRTPPICPVPQKSPTPTLPPPQPSPGGSGNPAAADITSKLQDRVNTITNTCSSLGMPFMELLQQYCNEGARKDIDHVIGGGRKCPEMQKLLAKEAGQFQSELELFLAKIDIIRQLFDVHSVVTPPANDYDIRAERDVDLDSFLTRLGDCKGAVNTLDKRISITVKEQAGMEVESMYGTALRSKSSSIRSSQSIPEYTFEVKADGGLKQTRAKLQVNVNLGRLLIVKGDDVQQYVSYQVLQIVKNNKSRSKLNVMFEGGKKREYIFESSSQREAFCQVMQLLRNTHSKNAEPDCVSIFIGAWNMGDAMPPVDIRSWFRCGGSGRVLDPSVSDIPHDIYVIGTQETGLPEKEWLHKCMETISEITGIKLHLVAMDALWHIKIIILVKEEHKNRISHVQTSSVKTGIANTLGNKGAVAVAFQFGGTSMCFINAHLTSGNEKCGRRNQNYHDIVRALNLGHDRCSMFDLTNRFDHLFFLGDLNYRLEMDVQEILTLIKKRDLPVLYRVDQLRREKEMNKVFYGFSEEEITFPPTYRYERDTRDVYSHLKIKRTGIRINVPSWCDRVLWKSYPETHNVCYAYGCTDDVMTSDHSPVFCNMQVGVRGQYVSNEGLKSGKTQSAQPATIQFESIEAILKAPGKTSFYLQFHSMCLASAVKTGISTRCDTTEFGPNCIRVIWDNIPQLFPIISDREYLVDQHLLVLIKSNDDNDSHAEFVLALRSMIGTTPQKFQEHLTRKGEDAGQIQGSMHVKTRDSTIARKEKTYDFIQISKREEIEPVLYSEAPDISSREPVLASRSSILSTVGNAVSKVIGQKQNKLSKTQGIKNRSPSDIRPQQIIDSRPPMQLPQTSQFVSPVTYDDATFTRSSMPASGTSSPQTAKQANRMSGGSSPQFSRSSAPTSGGSSPKQPGRQSSPVFPVNPVRFPQVTSEPVAYESVGALPTHDRNSSQSLDAVIAEFEAAGSWFDAMSRDDDDNSMNKQNLGVSPDTLTLNKRATSPSLQPRPMPPFPQPTPRYPPPTQSRAVIGQSPTPPISMRTVIGQATGPAPPPPAGPAPRLRQKSVRLPGDQRKVMSVAEMMSRLGLPQYTAALLENGWDRLEFLSDITSEDLMDCDIINENHKSIILDCVENMDYVE